MICLKVAVNLFTNVPVIFHVLQINSDLNQKYSLASIDEGNELGGFKHSNTILGVLGVGSLLYYVYYKQNIYK